MYSESDLDEAVAAGALTPEAAASLRASIAARRGAPAVDEEGFRLLTGFNDIFVTIAAVLLLVAVAWIGMQLGGGLAPLHGGDLPGLPGALATGGLAVAAAAWGLAEYFTRVRRMALPSIVLLIAYSWAVAFFIGGVLALVAGPEPAPQVAGAIGLATGLGTAAAVWAHWRRFHVPITIAALTIALVFALYSVLFAAFPAASRAVPALILLAGLAIFAFAMWWDMSDRERRTRRSDVAFWLHLAAAPMIAHPLFRLLGLLDGEVGAGQAMLVLVLYVAFGLVALAIDRRALLVSSLFYVLYALSALFRQFGAVSLNIALTALVIGSALLVLSAFWHPIRMRLVGKLPADWTHRLPPVSVARPRS